MNKVVITQTDYIDFISKSGTSKAAKVRSLHDRPKYHPAFDFYKPLREEIVEHLKYDKKKQDLFSFPSVVTDTKKRARYLSLINGYAKFIGRKKATWFDPPSANWDYKELRIKMNPEIGLILNSNKYIIKMYFKDSPLQSKDIKVLLWMMENSLCTGLFNGYKCALLDVENGKMHYSKSKDPSIHALLEGEAEFFLKLWHSLDRKSA